MTERETQSGRMKAVIRMGIVLCPNCLKRLCSIRAGGRARGVELWCKYCRIPVELNTR